MSYAINLKEIEERGYGNPLTLQDWLLQEHNDIELKIEEQIELIQKHTGHIADLKERLRINERTITYLREKEGLKV